MTKMHLGADKFSSAGSVMTIQNNFEIKPFDTDNHKFTYAGFRELTTRLVNFMHGRGTRERIGASTLISTLYFSEQLIVTIAAKITSIKKLWYVNNKSSRAKQKIMFELPDFVLDHEEDIDSDFLGRLHWAEALAWLEIYFKAYDTKTFIAFYKAASQHIKKNIVQTKHVSITTTNMIATDIVHAHAYFRKCLSINPQKHSSSTEKHYVSVGALVENPGHIPIFFQILQKTPILWDLYADIL